MPLLKSNRFLSIYSLLKDKNQQKSFLYILIRGISVISNYVFSILVIHLFSKEDYGNYVYGLSIFMLLSVFLKLGVDIHFVKIFSEFKSKIIPKWIGLVEWKVIYLSIAVCAGIIAFLYFTNQISGNNFSIILFILSVPFYVKVLLNSGKLRGISKIIEFAFLNIAGRILISLLVFVILYYLFSYRDSNSIYLAHFASIVVILVISMFWTSKSFIISKDIEDLKIPDNFFTYNNGLLLKSYITVFFLWGDRFLLSIISNPSEVAQYDICLKIAMLIMIVSEALKSTYAAVFAKHALEPEKLKIDIRKSTRVGFIISSMIFIVILFFGKFLLGLFGSEFKDSYFILLTISLGYTMSTFFGQADNVLEMCGLIKHYVKYYFIIIFLALGLGVVLSFSYGALGMAIGFAIGNFLFQAVASYIVRLKMSIKTSFL
ncbi:oligosaccharide flippase family protein [Winogradskyella sp. F6397]|uniref:Oligosaccharide flippase family protein n=1 Tax=Winogradskyella marina TaxID=2785530 RepID=A0ABS0EK02_9FLAO|nr:oligosaccharide flippase family protein [Winogradskyella marina]MBF8149006.1 oligosaccharide flippase family protein [Winogradskyella marina]